MIRYFARILLAVELESKKLFSFRSSRTVFCKKDVLKKFAKFTGKHMCQSLFLNKVAGLSPATLFKKRLRHRCFPVNFVNFLRTPFLQNTFDGYFCSGTPEDF